MPFRVGFHPLGERHTDWELNCPSATQLPSPWLPSVGRGFPHSGAPCALGCCWFTRSIRAPASLPSGNRAPGQALGKALQEDFERNVLVRCRNPPSSAPGHGGSTCPTEGTNIPERQGWEVSLPRTAVEGVRGSRTAREGCRGMQGGTACCHLGSFSTPTRKLLPWLRLAQTLAQDTPLEAMEFGENLWQQGSRPQLCFWLAKFIADVGRKHCPFKNTPRENFIRQSSAKTTATRQVSFSLWDVGQGAPLALTEEPHGVYVPQAVAVTGKDSKYSVIEESQRKHNGKHTGNNRLKY